MMAKPLPTIRTLFLTITLISGICTYAQSVGINNTDPQGILDVSSSTHGIVLPRVSLTKTNIAAPVVNPQGGALAVGTVVYNMNTTNTGSNDVYRGIYIWTGTGWYNKFTKKQSELFQQTSFFQPSSSAGYQNIPGLTGQSFVPNYSGIYKVEISVNFGGGYVLDLSTDTDVAAQSGTFQFTIDGTTYSIPVKATCSKTTGGTQYYAIWEQASIIEYITLTSGTSYTFDLKFDQDTSSAFVNSGNSGTGKGYIGIPDHLPCSVEFTYIGD